MNDQTIHPNLPVRQTDNDDKINLPGYPLYPVSEDIYNKSIKEEDIDPENIAILKTSNENDLPDSGNENDLIGTGAEFDLAQAVTGGDLDVPGSELDDEQEDIGSEDEENNYYSLGGDNHNNLDEDKGE